MRHMFDDRNLTVLATATDAEIIRHMSSYCEAVAQHSGPVARAAWVSLARHEVAKAYASDARRKWLHLNDENGGGGTRAEFAAARARREETHREFIRTLDAMRAAFDAWSAEGSSITAKMVGG